MPSTLLSMETRIFMPLSEYDDQPPFELLDTNKQTTHPAQLKPPISAMPLHHCDNDMRPLPIPPPPEEFLLYAPYEDLLSEKKQMPKPIPLQRSIAKRAAIKAVPIIMTLFFLPNSTSPYGGTLPSAEIEIITCHICEAPFSNLDELNSHLPTHTLSDSPVRLAYQKERMPCPVCSKILDKYYLREHIKGCQAKALKNTGK
jgi:hypothetical protein